jgi:hypothetical protein
METTWTAGVNTKFLGMSDEDISSIMGTILEEPEDMKLPPKKFSI